jgi:hypothetical protein
MSPQQLEGFKNDFEIKWHSAGLKRAPKKYVPANRYTILKAAYDRGILKLNPKYQQNGKNYRLLF